MRNLIVITGASRGIGRACALAFGKDARFDRNHIALIARNLEGLIETEEQILRYVGEIDVSISKHSSDLANMDTLEEDMKSVFQELSQKSQYKQAILINNAGSLGYIGRSSTLPSPKEIQKTIDFNVTSSIWMSSYFVHRFANELKVQKLIIVNMSSLCGVRPFNTMALYCTGKAAREMFHQTLGNEEEHSASSVIRVLNYAPGAIDTSMTSELESSDTLDTELSHFYRKSRSDKSYITPMDTATNLVDIIFDDTYKNGSHIDYWDGK